VAAERLAVRPHPENPRRSDGQLRLVAIAALLAIAGLVG